MWALAYSARPSCGVSGPECLSFLFVRVLTCVFVAVMLKPKASYMLRKHSLSLVLIQRPWTTVSVPFPVVMIKFSSKQLKRESLMPEKSRKQELEAHGTCVKR